MPTESQILLFSDIPDEVELIENVLREVSGLETVQIAKDEKTALDLLAKEKFELVFARSQKGALACTDFLNDVWKVNPRSTRFLLADGAPDAEALVRCALGAHQLIPTPLDPQQLSTALERANSIKRFVKSDRIHTLVSRMRTLPSRPSLYVELMRELRSVNASAATVGELVSKDLAISTKLIQVANSAFFGLEQHVSEPASAVLQLGLETTTALVLSIEAFARFDKVKPLYFSIDKVWKHSQQVADAARKICQAIGCEADLTANAFTAGLLHDIGKLALAQNFEEDYQRAIKESETRKLPIFEVEEIVFGGTHADTGAYLLAVWGLPLPIVEAVADHHLAPAHLTAPFSASTALHLAEQLANNPEKVEEVLARYPEQLGLAAYRGQIQAALGVTPAKKETPTTNAPASANATAEPKISIRPQLESKDPFRQSRPFALRGPALYGAIAAGVLLLAFVGVFSFRGAPKKVEATSASKPAVAATKPPEASEPKLVPKQEQLPPEPAKPQLALKAPNLKLQAIMYNGDKSGLIINGTMLHRGDTIDGWSVTAVTARQVTVQKNGAQETLFLQ
jgi:putative nucleotidyltransferase with HDIG domain